MFTLRWILDTMIEQQRKCVVDCSALQKVQEAYQNNNLVSEESNLLMKPANGLPTWEYMNG